MISGTRAATFINLLAFVGMLLVDVRHPKILLTTHGLLWIPILLVLLHKTMSFAMARTIIVAQAFAVTSVYGYILHANLAEHAEPRYIIASSSIYLTLAGGLPFFVPAPGRTTVVISALIGCVSWALLRQVLPVPVYHVALFFILSVSTIARLIYDSQICYQAMLEFDLRETMIQAERAKAEHYLELAREVQGALLPENGFRSGQATVHFHQLLHQTIGGDWVATRKTPKGMAVVVADASGKGVQAALIVQTLQTLWAEQPDGAAFEPDEWIAKVNRVLLALSREKPQTMTLGILEVQGRELTYWSAGHTPAFVELRAPGESSEILTFPARGDMLGIKPRINLKPMSCEIPAGVEATVMFGSDGVFDGVNRYGPRRIEGLFRAAQSDMTTLVENLDVEDDRTLVRLEVAA